MSIRDRASRSISLIQQFVEYEGYTPIAKFLKDGRIKVELIPKNL